MNCKLNRLFHQDLMDVCVGNRTYSRLNYFRELTRAPLPVESSINFHRRVPELTSFSKMLPNKLTVNLYLLMNLSNE